MKNFKYIFRCLTVLLIISGFFSIHVMASPHSQTGDFPQKKYQDPLDFPEEENSLLTPQTNAAPPAHFGLPTETFPISLVHIEVELKQKIEYAARIGFCMRQIGGV